LARRDLTLHSKSTGYSRRGECQSGAIVDKKVAEKKQAVIVKDAKIEEQEAETHPRHLGTTSDVEASAVGRERNKKSLGDSFSAFILR